MIRPITSNDAAAVAAIYNHYIANTIITFEENVVSPAEMNERIAQVTRSHPWLVDEEDGEIRGYAYASTWRARASYRHSTESTIYMAPAHSGRGFGSALYGELLALLERAGMHCIVGVIALPNPGSVALHEKLGFRKVGHLDQIGRKFDTWIDVGYWQRVL